MRGNAFGMGAGVGIRASQSSGWVGKVYLRGEEKGKPFDVGT